MFSDLNINVRWMKMMSCLVAGWLRRHVLLQGDWGVNAKEQRVTDKCVVVQIRHLRRFFCWNQVQDMSFADCASGAARVVDMQHGEVKEGRIRKDGGRWQSWEKGGRHQGMWHGKKVKLCPKAIAWSCRIVTFPSMLRFIVIFKVWHLKIHTIVVEEDGKLNEDDNWGYFEARCLVDYSRSKEDKACKHE